MTPAERASRAVRGRAGGYLAGADLTRSVEAAIRAAVADETERCAKVAADYAARMRASRDRHTKHGRSTIVADSKADAGQSIEAAIRGGQDAG